MTMKTMTRCTNLSRLSTAVLFSALALGFSAVSSAGVSVSTDQKTVKYADLDLSTSAGAAALYGRIKAAAGDICGSLDHGSLASKVLYHHCVDRGVEAAVAKVDRPALYAVYVAKSPAKPVRFASR
jgi:UrcA family protein